MRCMVRLAVAVVLAVAIGGCGGGRSPRDDAGTASSLVVSNRGGAWRIYETGRDGGGARLLGSPRADDASYADGQPARLPDGAVVFVSDRGGRPALWLCDRGGGNPRPLFAGGADAGRGSESGPAPFGADRIVFARAADPPAAAAGTGAAGIAPAAAGIGRDLYLVPRNGGVPRRLTGDPADDSAPCALPDGRSVVFVSERRGHPELYRLDASAVDPEATASPLWPDSAPSDDAPACLPDGSILFARSARGAPSHVFQARFGDGGPVARQITDAVTLPYGAGEPVPLADGTILLTAGPGPANGPRYAVYGISGGGYNLARVTRERAGYEDLTRRLRPPR